LGGCLPCRCASTESSIPGRSCQACKCDKSPDIARLLDFFAFEEIRISYGNREKKRLICVAIFNPGEANPFATRGRRVLFAPLQPPETNQRSSANTLVQPLQN
jgi:hypothetical protein